MTADEMLGPDDELDADDVAVLAAVEQLYTDLDPVPDDLALEIRFQLSVQALHAEVARLERAAPGQSEPRPAVGATRADDARTADPTRTETMTFSCDQLSAMITISTLEPGVVRIDGWVTAPHCAIELRVQPPGSVAAAPVTRLRADEDGRFTVARVDRGLAQFLFTDADRQPVITPYVEL